jgi:hypothetical protein
MTITRENSTKIGGTRKINRIFYGGFVALGLYFLLANHDISSAMSNFGLALIFDPFDQKIRWNNRPLYQRVWLFVHLAIVFVLLGMLIIV